MRNLMFCAAIFMLAIYAAPAAAQAVGDGSRTDKHIYKGAPHENDNQQITEVTDVVVSPEVIVPSGVAMRPKMQVVFLLDATGSMSHLMSAAKEKIWSIASSLTQTLPTPILEFGMIFYRDIGDDFVTRIIPLGTPMDDLYEVMMSMRADGGGDGPESVNQALFEGVTKMKWDTFSNTYRTIFLVGDYPPHMDYPNDVKYPESCKIAANRGITINTILMGNERTAYRIWNDIAARTNGEFIQTDMSVNNISYDTPYDIRIRDLQYELDITRIYYGVYKSSTDSKIAQSESIVTGIASSSARRAEYNMSESGKQSYYGSNELVNDVINGLKLSSIAKTDLPDNLQKMSLSALESHVNNLINKRKELEKEIVELTNKRTEYISEQVETMDAEEVESSFDEVIFKTMKKQAATKSIEIKGESKK